MPPKIALRSLSSRPGQPSIMPTGSISPISSFKAISEGKYDNLPEQAFYMVGGIEDVENKAKGLER